MCPRVNCVHSFYAFFFVLLGETMFVLMDFIGTNGGTETKQKTDPQSNFLTCWKPGLSSAQVERSRPSALL